MTNWEEHDRKCNIYASQNLFQQEPRHDDYGEESDANEFEPHPAIKPYDYPGESYDEDSA